LLWPIDNGDGDGSYVVSWQAGLRADSYELEEQWQDGEWFRVYSGSDLQAPINNRPAGAYAYRCRSLNGWGQSGWSNVQTVTVPGTLPGTISTPSSGSVNAGGKVLVKVINDCPHGLHVEFTGQQPDVMNLPACGVCHVYSFIGPIFCPTTNRPAQEKQLEPGTYRVYVWVDDPSIKPWVGQWPLQGNRRYTVCFSIVQSWASPTGGGAGKLVVGDCEQ
jgi:hypothetical protein